MLLFASIEDAKYHKVNKVYVFLLALLGCVQVYVMKENRWVSLTLTCFCFMVLCFIYYVTRILMKHFKRQLKFGGADVRLIPCMMLVQGWDTALTGVLIGFIMAVVWCCINRCWEKEIPLVPWMSIGCIIAELLV